MLNIHHELLLGSLKSYRYAFWRYYILDYGYSAMLHLNCGFFILVNIFKILDIFKLVFHLTIHLLIYLQQCHIDDHVLFAYLVPYVYDKCANEVKGSIELIKLLAHTLDAKQIADLVGETIRENISLFKYICISFSLVICNDTIACHLYQYPLFTERFHHVS